MTHHHTIRPRALPTYPVDSESIKEIGYDAQARVLRIRYHSGACYDYEGITPHLHESLMDAISLSAFVVAHVLGKYSFTKVQ